MAHIGSYAKKVILKNGTVLLGSFSLEDKHLFESKYEDGGFVGYDVLAREDEIQEMFCFCGESLTNDPYHWLVLHEIPTGPGL